MRDCIVPSLTLKIRNYCELIHIVLNKKIRATGAPNLRMKLDMTEWNYPILSWELDLCPQQ